MFFTTASPQISDVAWKLCEAIANVAIAAEEPTPSPALERAFALERDNLLRAYRNAAFADAYKQARCVSRTPSAPVR